MIEQNKDGKRAGLAGTIAIHALLLIVLFLLTMLAPKPPEEEEGILISFGNVDYGSGDVQPQTPTEVVDIEESDAEVEEAPPPDPVEPTQVQPNQTQDVEEAPAIKPKEEKPKPKEPKPVVKPKEEPKEEKPKVDTRALYPGKKNTTNNSSSGSQGDTQQPGDAGSIDGSLNSNSSAGSGLGDSGVKWSLAGRKMVVAPKIKDTSQKTGVVVINITVDKNGNVTNASGPGRGSTTSDNSLVSKAKTAALQTKFNSSSTGTVLQKGTITFTFILK